MKKKFGEHLRLANGKYGRRAPKPFEKWLARIGVIPTGNWEHSSEGPAWLPTAQTIATQNNVILIYDPKHHWTESHYLHQPVTDDGEVHCSLLAVGGKGSPSHCCSAFLHELGHHILFQRGQWSNDFLSDEENAWKIAHEVANEYRLPCLSSIRRQALYGYRFRAANAKHDGSKQKTRRRPKPKSLSLSDSKRSALISEVPEEDAMQKIPRGNKGKRLNKKHVKHTTAKAERKAAKEIEDQ